MESAPRRAALSPSRAKEFKQCPLLFRLRQVDRVPEPPAPAAVRGTLVHSVLEHLFLLPAQARTVAAAQELVVPRWEEMVQSRPEVAQLASADPQQWFAQVRALVEQYFRQEDPTRLEPRDREKFLEVELADGTLIRGIVDRIDAAPDGRLRVVDYKTGKAPSPRFIEEALFQLRFYALLLERTEGTLPARLQIIYLGNGRTLTHDPHPDETGALEREIGFLWDEVAACLEAGSFSPRRTRLCDWCNFQSLCPAYGGAPPELNPADVARVAATRA
ncbi:MAG: PD-(D/E)XK nuclease family protein [Buchananella hordeovulneris]|nr:PD-(D/E)XK nuclease family protein [Buchananella hordeovulneris]